MWVAKVILNFFSRFFQMNFCQGKKPSMFWSFITIRTSENSIHTFFKEGNCQILHVLISFVRRSQVSKFFVFYRGGMWGKVPPRRAIFNLNSWKCLGSVTHDPNHGKLKYWTNFHQQINSSWTATSILRNYCFRHGKTNILQVHLRVLLVKISHLETLGVERIKISFINPAQLNPPTPPFYTVSCLWKTFSSASCNRTSNLNT